MPETLCKQQIINKLNMDYKGATKLIAASPDFPEPVNARKSAREKQLFDTEQVMDWMIGHQKGFCIIRAQQAISGKLWPIHTKPLEPNA